MSNNNRSGARAFLGDFGKALLMGSPALAGMAGLFSPAAQEARKDQSGFLPEFGLTEGIRSIMPSKEFVPAVGKTVLGAIPGASVVGGMFTPEAAEARKDQSGFFPELGISEGLAAMNPLSGYNNQVAPEAIAAAGEGAAEIGAKVDNFLKDQWLAKTANSPAQQSGAWSTPEGKDQLWQQHLMNQDFQQAKKSGTLDDFAAKYPHSQTAKERAIRNKIPSSLEMEF